MRARPAPDHDPRQRRTSAPLIVFPTVTTHAPFRALPPYREDWPSLLGAEAFTPEEVDAAEAEPTEWSNPLPAYLASMRYQFDWLADYLAHHAPANLVTIVIGDHQPVGSVSGPDQPWDVPAHVYRIGSTPARPPGSGGLRSRSVPRRRSRSSDARNHAAPGKRLLESASRHPTPQRPPVSGARAL